MIFNPSEVVVFSLAHHSLHTPPLLRVLRITAWLACVETHEEGLFVIKSAKKPVQKADPLKKQTNCLFGLSISLKETDHESMILSKHCLPSRLPWAKDFNIGEE